MGKTRLSRVALRVMSLPPADRLSQPLVKPSHTACMELVTEEDGGRHPVSIAGNETGSTTAGKELSKGQEKHRRSRRVAGAGPRPSWIWPTTPP